MKTARTLISIVLLFAATTAVFAQTENRSLMKVSIPFSFTVDSQKLPAGQYYVIDVVAERTLGLTTADRKHTVIVNDLPSYANKAPLESHLVFQRYGDEYFLTEVWCKGNNVERSPMAGKQATALARNGVSAEPVIILAYAVR
jgi:hypothetical protein